MASAKSKVLCLREKDNVAIASEPLEPGDGIGEGGLICREEVPAGHKVAIRHIPVSEPIWKYSQIIGFASRAIEPGNHVHTHNMEMGDFARDYAFGADARPSKRVTDAQQVTFEGIVRKDGRVGTRNYIGVLATVNCSTSVARFVADSVTGEIVAEFPNIDGVVPLGHGTGCCLLPDGEAFVYLQR
ncbi:MAG: UxaA family hydrolase, partial [Desulfobacteraceae bacterium]